MLFGNFGWKMAPEVCLWMVLFLAIVTVSGKKETGEYDVTKIISLDSTEDYVINYPDIATKNPYRVEVKSLNATARYPILVVVKQERSVTSWQIPLLVQSSSGLVEYRETGRTLCYDTEDVIKSANRNVLTLFGFSPVKKNFTVILSTASIDPVEVSIKAYVVREYFIESNTKYPAKFTPSQPLFYSYTFPKTVIENDDIKTVLVHVESSDDTCFTVSVQKKVCPVHDLNDDISYDGKFQTVNTKGGLTIDKYHFPDGFLLVFVSKGDNHDCNEGTSLLPQHRTKRIIPTNQTTEVWFEVRLGKTSNEYLGAILAVFFTIFVVCVVMLIISITFYFCGNHRKVETYLESTHRVLDVSLDDIDGNLSKPDPKVCDFVIKGRTNKKQSMNYFWHISNIAIFYGIPVVQLMISYQRAVNFSGNLDICYHNYHCSHPFYFTDFNHIFSNIGYVMFGLLFLGITYFRDKNYRNKPNCGIPKLYGLYYSMGFALIFEGVLSGCYHICPNQSNFQFDTSFMYVMAALIMVKLYQNRHPDVNASAYGTFSVLGIAVVLAMFGILFNSMAIMIIFIIVYIAFCIYVAFKIYFFGYVVRGFQNLYHTFQLEEHSPKVLKPIRIGKFITLTLANIINFMIAITGLALYPNQVDFGTFLLGILLMNSVVYAIFYLVMKLIAGERICVEAILYGILSLIAWGFGGYFFLNAATIWSATPAESRQLNKDCILMGFYDTHDIWHLLSAPALYFSFMFLLALDDDLYDKPQNEINAF